MKNTINLCKCNLCDSILIDTNSQINAKEYTDTTKTDGELIILEDMKACPKCKTDEYLIDL